VDAIKLLELKINSLRNLLTEVIKHSKDFSDSAAVITEALKANKTIFWCGNGGSAAESLHLAAELIGRFSGNRAPLSSVALNADIAALTCIANDFGYSQIFSRQLDGLGKKGDVLIVLSTSGKSENISNALIKAKELEIKSIAFLGKGGGEARDLADISFVIDSDETARIQEIHLFLGHLLCEIVEINLGFSE
jgi:D-sedoheptulose 7-phosphate isomerase